MKDILKLDGCEVVKNLVNECIRQCYVLDEKLVKVLNVPYAKEWGIYDEPINWGDLTCYDVVDERDDKGIYYIAYIEEASPSCVEFREYIKDWLKAWGWEVNPITEW